MSQEMSDYVAENKLKRPSGQHHSLRLQDQVKNRKLWPTPRAKEPGRTTEGYGRGLAELVEGKEQVKVWPTPTQDSVSERTKKYAQGGTPLPLAVKMWPTPRASEWKDVGPVGSKSHTHMDKRDYLCAKVKDPDQPGGSLNPAWVEWLMGYSPGWTDCEGLETPLSRKSPMKSSGQ